MSSDTDQAAEPADTQVPAEVSPAEQAPTDAAPAESGEEQLADAAVVDEAAVNADLEVAAEDDLGEVVQEDDPDHAEDAPDPHLTGADVLIQMKHPEGGTCDRYERVGDILIVPALDVPLMRDHGFEVVTDA